MKFCPKCGAQLVDEARFCSKCGAPQPNMDVQATPQPAVEPQQVKPNQSSSDGAMTPGQRYNYLQKNDEKFKATTRVVFFLKLVGLFNLLFIIPWLVCYFVPVGIFTGDDLSSIGETYITSLGKSFPCAFNNYELAFKYKPFADGGNYKLTPDNALGSNVFSSIMWFFTFVFIPLLVLVALLGYPRGYSASQIDVG